MNTNTTEQLELITEKVVSNVKDILEIPKISIDEDLTLLGLDSIRSIELIVDLESEFDITFDDSELLLDNFKTITLITNNIREKMGI